MVIRDATRDSKLIKGQSLIFTLESSKMDIANSFMN